MARRFVVTAQVNQGFSEMLQHAAATSTHAPQLLWRVWCLHAFPGE